MSGVSTPKTFGLAIRKLTLLGGDGTDDFVVLEEEDSSAVEALQLLTDGTELGSAMGAAEAGTYTGLEMQVWWMDMTLPLVIEEVSLQPTSTLTAGWFADAEPFAKRDVTVAILDDETGETTEYWVDRDTWSLAMVEDDRPEQVLDLWHDEDFWDQDPVTLSSAEDAADFRFSYEGDGIEIPATEDAEIVITMGFDVSNRFTWWEYLPDDDPDQADGIFTVGEDCGFRVLFPDVSITIEEI